MNTCLRCGNEWVAKVENPKCCPGCKSPAWNRAKVSSAVATRAHGLVAKAKADGVLVVEPCSVCGSTDRIQAHHEDYDNPLDVTWYCAKHHRARHAEIGDALMDTNGEISNLFSLRMPIDLKRLLDIEATRRGVSLASLVVELCWRGLEVGVPVLHDSESPARVEVASGVVEVLVPAAVFSPLSIPGVVRGADIFAGAEFEEEEEIVPRRSFPVPGCPRCRIPMTDTGVEFVCGKGVCKQKAMSVETAEYQWENRGVGA